MNFKHEFLATAAAVAVVAFVLAPTSPVGAQLWPEPAAHVEPVGIQVALFAGYGLYSAIALGVAVAYLAFGYRFTRAALAEVPSLAPWAHVGIVWVMGNFWLHDSLHMMVGEDAGGLIALEWGFHATMMVAAGILMLAFARTARARRIGFTHTEGEVEAGEPAVR